MVKLKVSAILLLLALIAAFTQAAPSSGDKDIRRRHPGCIIWWFLPQCPLARIFGPDPFGIYPWKRFCKRFSAFDNTDFCLKYKVSQEEADKQSLVPRIDSDDEAEKMAARIMDIPETKENLELLCSSIPGCLIKTDNAVQTDSRRQPKANNRPKRQSDKILIGIKDAGKQIGENYMEKKCEASNGKKLGFVQRQLCKQVMKRIAKNREQRRDHQQRQRGKRHAEVGQDHPGCTFFWFLPGCPLGNALGVDPFDNYPWESLCLFRALRGQPQCQLKANLIHK